MSIIQRLFLSLKADVDNLKLPDDVMHQMLNTVFPVIFGSCGSAVSPQTPSKSTFDVYLFPVRKPRFLAFDFGVYKATLPVLRNALIEHCCERAFSTNSTEKAKRHNDAKFDQAKRDYDFQINELQKEHFDLQMKENQATLLGEQRELRNQRREVEAKINKLVDEWSFNSNSLQKEKAEMDNQLSYRFDFDQPMDYNCLSNHMMLHSTSQARVFRVTVRGGLVMKIEPAGQQELREEFYVSRTNVLLTPSRKQFFVYALLMMQISLMKPSTPLPGVLDFTHFKDIDRAGLHEALGLPHLWSALEVRNKYHELDYFTKEKIVSYLNGCLFQICNGSSQFGVLKFTCDGLPEYDILKSFQDLCMQYKSVYLKVLFLPEKKNSLDDEEAMAEEYEKRRKKRKKKKQNSSGEQLNDEEAVEEEEEEVSNRKSFERAQMKEIDVFQLWVKDERHTCVSKITWIPWGDYPSQTIEAKHGLQYPSLNSYVGMRYSLSELKKAFDECPADMLHEVKQLIFNNLCNSNEEEYRYICMFLASCLQYPFRKLGSFLFLIGAGGIGKGVIICALGHLLGSCFHHNKAGDTLKRFNTDYCNKSTIFFDEVQLDKASYAWLKTAITENTQRMEQKFRDSKELPSFWNCIGASNDFHQMQANIDSSDRRFYIADCLKVRSPVHVELAKKVGQNMPKDDFKLNKAFGWWLLSLNVTNFDASKIPMTEAAKFTQRRSDQNSVLLFFSECLETQTLIVSPGYDFIRHFLTGDNLDGVTDPLIASSSSNPAINCRFNPLHFIGDMYEHWSRWYNTETRPWLITEAIWDHLKLRHKEWNISPQFLDMWMRKGGWLRAFPVQQFFARFQNWLKAKGMSNRLWNETAFVEQILTCVPYGKQEYETVKGTQIQFLTVPDIATCKAYFAATHRMFRVQNVQWKSSDEIVNPPPLPLNCLSQDYVVKLKQNMGTSCAYTRDFAEQLEYWVNRYGEQSKQIFEVIWDDVASQRLRDKLEQRSVRRSDHLLHEKIEEDWRKEKAQLEEKVAAQEKKLQDKELHIERLFCQSVKFQAFRICLEMNKDWCAGRPGFRHSKYAKQVDFTEENWVHKITPIIEKDLRTLHEAIKMIPEDGAVVDVKGKPVLSRENSHELLISQSNSQNNTQQTTATCSPPAASSPATNSEESTQTDEEEELDSGFVDTPPLSAYAFASPSQEDLLRDLDDLGNAMDVSDSD